MRGAAVAAINELFALKDKDGTPLRNADEGALLPPLGSYPSVDQVRRLLEKVLTVSGRFKKRNGAASFENNHAASTGSVLDDCVGPGDVYEIDSTIVDAYIVARANRAVIIGKSTLYLIIDRWSRLIVGFYLSLEPPSWAEGTQAILSIASDWGAVCKRLGVKYDPRVWPACEVMPNRFFGDRGDMISTASNALCDGVQVQVTNAPALNSQAKPIVESGFLTTHVPMRDNVPGYEPPTNPFKRRAKKFHKDACLTLDELAGIYLGIIQTHNRKVKTGYQASPEEILNDQSSKPYEIWQRGISDRMGLLSRMPIAMLRRKLSPTDTGVVKKDGIHFRGCIYHSHELREWITKASLNGSFEVVVRYQTNLVDSVTVISPSNDQREYEVSLTTTCEAYAGYSFAEVKFVRDQKARQDISGKHTNLAQDVALRQDTLKVAESTSAEMQAVTGNMTPGMRKSDSDVYRAAEARQRRQAVNSTAGAGQQYLQTGADSDVDSASASNKCGATPNDSPPEKTDAPSIAARIAPSDSAANAPELDALLQKLLN